jgi:putative DNA primase/helicase
MTAATIAQALGGYRTGRSWSARCPAHDDRNPSLSVRDKDDGGVLVHCFAGCAQRDVIGVLVELGLWAAEPMRSYRSIPASMPPGMTVENEPTDADRISKALRLWDEARPSPGTPVAKYLSERCITLPSPDCLRYHPAARHSSGETWPCMIALVTDGVDGHPMAIHRTFLSRDGGDKARIEPNKMMLGPCRGGVVRLAPATTSLMVGEGIETCLSAMQAMGKPAWSALSASGLRALRLPQSIQEITILSDGDKAGEDAAQDAGLRWKREGRHVRKAVPGQGLDFNDIHMGQATGLSGAGR